MWRNNHADLNGYVALVTGARMKIGFHVALRLLRDDATVIATTRFPGLAAQAYQAEPDFDQWSHRLHLAEVDLLHVDELGVFFSQIAQFGQLDILVNNAAITVKDANEPQWRLNDAVARRSLPPGLALPVLDETIDAPLPAVAGASSNTWVGRSQDIDLREVLEVQLVNVVGPYLLATVLKPLMMAGPARNRFVINVSSVEGKFSVRSKSAAHPHTNMAKAALNMMTMTLGGEYREAGIFVYSVDPGWVSNQFPAEWGSPPRALPLDFEDAAARIVHPILAWADDTRPPTGIFLKDYHPTDW